MVTAGCLSDVKECSQLINELQPEFPAISFSTTVGVHPCRASEFNNGPYLHKLKELARNHRDLGVRAVGELGLDYARLEYSTPEEQRACFEEQFILADITNLPLFLHMRDAAQDFCDIVGRNRHRFDKGVVHSFTGTADEAKQMLDLDLFIGINGWLQTCILSNPFLVL